MEIAQQKAAEHQRALASEAAVKTALTLYSDGVSFTDLPDEVTDAMTPVARLAARTVYAQQIAGEAAPYNWELEVQL